MTLQGYTPLVPFIATAAWACGLLVVDLFVPRDRKGVTAALAALGLLISLALAVLLGGRGPASFGGMFVLDGFAALLDVVFLASGVAGVLMAFDYLRRMQIERGEFYVLLLFAVSGTMLMASATDLIVIFLALELLSIPLYVLAGFARPRLASEEASLKYFLLGAFATGFLVYGVALVYGGTGSTGLARIAERLAELAAQGQKPWLALAGGGLILVGLGFKVAAVPFHMWTPDVYEGAPTPVSGFMSVAAKAAGVAALLRILVTALPALGATWVPVVSVIAGLTMILGNIAAIAQTSLKRMLAYSSIAHAGYVLIAVAAAGVPAVAPTAIAAALFYLAAYAVANLGAWAVVVALEREWGVGLEPNGYAGLARRDPGLALAMTVFMLSLIGLPPTAGLIGKLYVFRAALQAGLVWLAVIGVATSLVSTYYYLSVLVTMYMREGQPAPRRDALTRAVMGVTALAALALGLFPGPVMGLAARAVMAALGGG